MRPTTQLDLRQILESAAKTKAAAGSDTQLIGGLYASCMDEPHEKAGPKPIQPYSSRSKRKDRRYLIERLRTAHMGIPVMFGFGAGPDLELKHGHHQRGPGDCRCRTATIMNTDQIGRDKAISRNT